MSDDSKPQGRSEESIQQKAARAADRFSEQASEATEAAKQKALEAAERAKESGRQYATEQKTRVAEEIGILCDALHKAAEKLEHEQHASLACYVDAAAGQLDQLRGAIRDRQVGELVSGAQDFARRRPEIVYGGMFIAGLAAVRFLKASSPPRATNGSAVRRSRGESHLSRQDTRMSAEQRSSAFVDPTPRSPSRPMAESPEQSSIHPDGGHVR